MKRIITLLTYAMCFVGFSAFAGVLEQVTVDPNTGTIIGVRDYEESFDYAEVKKKPKPRTPETTVENKAMPNEEPLALKESEIRTADTSSSTPSPTAVGSESVVTAVEQPVVKAKPKQNALQSTRFEYLLVNKPSKRIYINDRDGMVFFELRKGWLKENIVALLESTNAEPPVMSGISDNHKVPATIWIYGETVLDVLDAILISYKRPYPIVAEPFANRIVEVKYDEKG